MSSHFVLKNEFISQVELYNWWHRDLKEIALFHGLSFAYLFQTLVSNVSLKKGLKWPSDKFPSTVISSCFP